MAVSIHICKGAGISALTEAFIKEDEGKFVARMGFCLFGSSMMNEEQLAACDYNPFHKDFFDNYVEGTGDSEEEALEMMKNRIKGISCSLWE